MTSTIAKPYRSCLKLSSINCKAYVGISLHSNSHTGESLEAVINWINTESRYETLLIGLSDTLNRFNCSLKLSGQEAHKKCRMDGDRWLSNNEYVLAKLKIPYQIKRWDDWKTNYPKETNQYLAFFENLFTNDLYLKNAVIKDINQFCLRKHGMPIDKAPFSIISNCKKYLIEELAIYSIIFQKYSDCDVLYPGKQLNCMEVIRNGVVQAIPNTYETTTYIRMALHSLNNDKKAA